MKLLEEAQALVKGEVTTDVREIRDRLDDLYEKAKGREKILIGQLDEALQAMGFDLNS